jgi:hypothetical protein
MRTLLTIHQYFFASNVLLILVHGFSRACVGFTLLHTGATRSHSKPAITILSIIALWTIGSVIGVIVNRLSGPSFWLPVGEDCKVGRTQWDSTIAR